MKHDQHHASSYFVVRRTYGSMGPQDREPLRMDTVRLCGGGTGGSLQVADLPMGYTLGYEKANGCPVQLSVSRCAPALYISLVLSCTAISCGMHAGLQEGQNLPRPAVSVQARNIAVQQHCIVSYCIQLGETRWATKRPTAAQAGVAVRVRTSIVWDRGFRVLRTKRPTKKPMAAQSSCWCPGAQLHHKGPKI